TPALWIAAERLPELLAVHAIETTIAAPPSRASRTWTRDEAIVELIRGRLTIVGPTTALALAESLAMDTRDAETALLTLEAEGAILRGFFEQRDVLEWCDRRLLARIHRYTLNRLRAEIEPVTAADFMRFLFAWQHVTEKLDGIDGLQRIVRLLDGFEIANGAWERTIFPLRMDRYDSALLDMLCLTGQVGWAATEGATAIFLRENADAWQTLRGFREIVLSEAAQRILDTLRARGALFARDLGDDVEEALKELVSAGLVTSDGFLRKTIASAGRWSALQPSAMTRESAVEIQARAFLLRYGVVFRRLLAREPNAAPWRELTRVYRRLEARGEIRGGRFVTGMSGEQFALPEAVERLREIRREGPNGRVVVISAADPLNLVGILDAGERVRAIAANKIAYRDGIAVSAMEGDYLRPLAQLDDPSASEVAAALAGRRVPVSRGYVGRMA
ncbi:MAG TPA: ATP-dependent DNA helicase, partial [Thermoanaerobaculia bacterium]